MEREANATLPFMDLSLYHSEGNIEAKVYRKPTHTGRYLQFTSNHPDSAKRSVIQALYKRRSYVSNNEARAEEDERVVKELEMNGYPGRFITGTISRLNQERHLEKAEHQQSLATAYVPYVKGISETIRRLLKPLNIETVMCPRTIKWSLMTGAKDSIPLTEQPGVIYSVGCLDCPLVYVGETGRQTKVRMKEHQAATRHGHVDKSAIALHAHMEGHRICWDPQIVAKEENTTKRKVTEALIIYETEQKSGTMNKDSGLELSKLWKSLAHVPH